MRRRVVFVMGALLLSVTACGGDEIAERIIESQEDGVDVEIDEDSGEVQIQVEDEEGDVSAVIGGGEVPDDFPIPVAGGGDVQAVFQQGDESTVQLLYEKADFESLREFYDSWSEGAGSEVLNRFESSNPPSFGVTVIDGDRAYTVSVSEVGEDVLVSLFVGRG